MDDATRTGARPLRVLRIVYRVVFALALVVLLVLIGIKRAPAVIAAMAPSPSTAAVAEGPSSAAAPTRPTTTGSAVPTISVPAVTLPPSSSGGGGGSSGGGGTTTATKPAPTRPAVTSLSAPNVVCPLQPTGAPDATTVPDPEVTVSWSSTGGTRAWFGIQTSDAEAAPYAEEPLSGSVTLNWPCAERQQLYTLTVEGPGGKTSRSITVRNTGSVG